MGKMVSDIPSKSDWECREISVKCKVCRTECCVKVQRDSDPDFPIILKCYCCMSDEPHVPC